MGHRFLQTLSTPAVKAARLAWDGVDRYQDASQGSDYNDRLGSAEAAFVSERDGFYLASVSESGWPYIQFRGGPKGFLRVLDDATLGFADFRGNRQYLTVGNVAQDNRVALFLMDYANRRRLKLLGRLTFVTDADVIAQVAVPGYPAKVERAARIELVGFDWNCPQHITERFSEEEITAAVAPLHDRIAELEAENLRLRTATVGGDAG